MKQPYISKPELVGTKQPPQSIQHRLEEQFADVAQLVTRLKPALILGNYLQYIHEITEYHECLLTLVNDIACAKRLLVFLPVAVESLQGFLSEQLKLINDINEVRYSMIKVNWLDSAQRKFWHDEETMLMSLGVQVLQMLESYVDPKEKLEFHQAYAESLSKRFLLESKVSERNTLDPVVLKYLMLAANQVVVFKDAILSVYKADRELASSYMTALVNLVALVQADLLDCTDLYAVHWDKVTQEMIAGYKAKERYPDFYVLGLETVNALIYNQLMSVKLISSLRKHGSRFLVELNDMGDDLRDKLSSITLTHPEAGEISHHAESNYEAYKLALKNLKASLAKSFTDIEEAALEFLKDFEVYVKERDEALKAVAKLLGEADSKGGKKNPQRKGRGKKKRSKKGRRHARRQQRRNKVSKPAAAPVLQMTKADKEMKEAEDLQTQFDKLFLLNDDLYLQSVNDKTRGELRVIHDPVLARCVIHVALEKVRASMPGANTDPLLSDSFYFQGQEELDRQAHESVHTDLPDCVSQHQRIETKRKLCDRYLNVGQSLLAAEKQRDLYEYAMLIGKPDEAMVYLRAEYAFLSTHLGKATEDSTGVDQLIAHNRLTHRTTQGVIRSYVRNTNDFFRIAQEHLREGEFLMAAKALYSLANELMGLGRFDAAKSYFLASLDVLQFSRQYAQADEDDIVELEASCREGYIKSGQFVSGWDWCRFPAEREAPVFFYRNADGSKRLEHDLDWAACASSAEYQKEEEEEHHPSTALFQSILKEYNQLNEDPSLKAEYADGNAQVCEPRDAKSKLEITP